MKRRISKLSPYVEREVLTKAVHRCRTEVMRIVEQALDGSPRWGFVRKELLRAYGHRGLEGELDQIFLGLPESEDQSQLELFNEENYQ